MMTLDEAIKHAEEKASEQETCAKAIEDRWGNGVKGYSVHSKCAEEQRQLAEWLKELKRYRENPNTTINLQELSNIPDPCKVCSNHPINGGSGICHCTLGAQKIT